MTNSAPQESGVFRNQGRAGSVRDRSRTPVVVTERATRAGRTGHATIAWPPRAGTLDAPGP
ncbi:MAG: hypothetical protein ACREPA_12055 [Candidatus Dormibacteraceae bacterium]